jgi:hypothetical protein
MSREHRTSLPGGPDAFFDARHAETPTAHDLPALGRRAFGTGTGDVTVVEDDMTLTVDAAARLTGSRQTKEYPLLDRSGMPEGSGASPLLQVAWNSGT